MSHTFLNVFLSAVFLASVVSIVMLLRREERRCDQECRRLAKRFENEEKPR
ncbi:MAG: hypothetical protein AB7G11_11140 [Phycisphaerales bacterium]